MRSSAVVAIALSALLAGCSKAPSAPAAAAVLTVYKSPTCGCCAKWTDHVNAGGLETEVVAEQDIAAVQKRLGVPAGLQSCHVAVAGDYLIVGHVPADDIKRLLAEKPAARGLAVPGMPVGSPGMEHGDHRQAYDTMLFQADGRAAVFARHGQ